MKVTLPKDINKTQRKVSLRSWITLLIGAAALLGLFFLLRLPGLPPGPLPAYLLRAGCSGDPAGIWDIVRAGAYRDRRAPVAGSDL